MFIRSHKYNLIFMKYLKIIMLLTISIFAIVATSTEIFAAKNDTATAQIELKEPVTLDTLLIAGANYPFDGMILQSNFTFNNEAIQDFYVADTNDKSKNIKEDYIKNRKAFIADVKKITELSPADTKNIENILITSFTVTGKKSNIDGIQKGLQVIKMDIRDTQAALAPQTDGKANLKPKEARLFGDKDITAAAQTRPMYLSLPTSGISYFYPSTSGGRYVQQNMKWPANYFAPEETYEHDVNLYNYDRKTYLNGASTGYPNCFPTTTYASTSWPAASKPYLDTRFDITSCEIDELSYTIGAAQANAIPANVDQFTYIRTANGNDATDKFKLQGQVGYRFPSICYTTWCSSPYKIYTIIPSWSTLVPGTQSWTYKGQAPEAPSKVSVTPLTTNSLRVNFTDNTYDETNILIERKTGTGGSWVSLGGFGILDKTGTWYWDNTGLASKIMYCYRLKAINAVGSSPYSNEACGTTL